MNLWQVVATLGRGALTAAAAQRRETPRKPGCTPCAAAAYVDGLKAQFQTAGAPPASEKKKKR